MIALIQDEGGQLAPWLERLEGWAVDYGPKVLAALATLVIGWTVARVLTGALRRLLARARVEPTLAGFLGNIAYIALMTFVLVAAIGKLGVQTASLIAILGAAGFAVAFALQGSLGNLASGVMIMVFRPFKVGDYVEAGGAAGTILEVGIFASTFKTPDNKKVIVANSSITGANITNYSANPTRRVDMRFGIAYDDDLRKAKQILLDVLAADQRVLEDPAPVVALAELGDSSVNLHCRPWAATSDYWDVPWDVQEKVKLAFDEQGITIPFPQRDVHLHQVA